MSQTTKVYEFAKEMGMETLTLMDKIREWNLPVKSHMAALDDDLIGEIKKRLDEDSEEKSAASKKKKKKATTKKKKVAKKKTTASKKKVVKKAITKKTVVKKKAIKKIADEAAEKSANEEANKKKVIRRKAGSKQAEEEAKAKAAAEAQAEAEAEAAAVAAAAAAGEALPDADEAVAVAAESAAPAEPAKRGMGRNIVGKIDLAVTRRPAGAARSSTTSPGPSAAGMDVKPSRTSPRTNLRAGFIAPSISEKSAEEVQKEKALKKRSTKEAEQKTFTSSDFRKREVVFQPKKKRTVIRGATKKTQLTTPKASKRIIKMYETISLTDLANELKVKTPQLTKKLIENGVMAKMNTMLDFDTVTLIAPEFGFEAQTLHRTEGELIEDVAFGELDAERIKRPPVVTVMGHVDHGKTTLLDTIRKANVASGEAGGITQHIGAYEVKTSIGEITFIDTPGHAAFSQMRARGANITDIAIIIVSADDGVMPQTVEAISHAKAANVPIIVAVNKIDKPGANVEKIKQQLMEYELIAEEWGGSTLFCEVSALNGTGIEELLEQISLLADMEDYKANPKRSATGVVIESKMEKGKGAVATILIQDGTVKVGDIIVAGEVQGKIRLMTNDRGQRVKLMGPGKPVEVTGLPASPMAGDQFDVCENEDAAKILIESRADQQEQVSNVPDAISLDKIFAQMKSGNFNELPLILKGDVAGSLEAIKASLAKIGNEEVKVKVIHTAVGGITESDVLLATTSGGLVVGFNVRPDTLAQKLAKEKGIDIKCYKIIYELLDDVKLAMSGLLAPDLVEKGLGSAEVREIFSVPKLGVIAGTFVVDGKIVRGSKLRLVREGKLIYEGDMASLKRFKDDAKEVASGYECGIGIENYNDIKVGDIIEAYIIEEVARSLD